MKDATRCLLFALTLGPLGCDSAPRLDTSSDEALTASIERMNAGQDESQRQELLRAISTLVAPRLAERTNPSVYQTDTAQMSQAELLRPYDGFTARQLMARAKEQGK